MNCARIERELSAYVDGEVHGARREQVERHLADCERCRVALARLRQTARLVATVPEVAPPASLAARVFAQVAPESAPAMTCAEAGEQVHAYADGWLSPAEVARLESHLRECAECEGELRRVRAIKQAAASLPEVAPPASVREAVAAAMAARQARAPRRLRPWAWAAIGTTAAAAAAWLVTLIGPQPTPDSRRTAATRTPAPPAAEERLPAPAVAGADETERDAAAAAPSFIERVTHRLRGAPEAPAAEDGDAIAGSPPVAPPVTGRGPGPAEPAKPTANGTEPAPAPVSRHPAEPPAPVEGPVVAVMPPPDAPETDAWEAVGVVAAVEPTRGEDTVAAAEPREPFRLSRPIEHKEITIRASGRDRRGRPMRGSDGGYVAVINTPL